MREVFIVARRELRSYFTSPIAYVFGGLFLFAMMFGPALTLMDGMPTSGVVRVFFAMMPVTLLVFLPALTMRLWAEERKLGTLELLMTFPVRVCQLVAGKFLAAMLFLAITIGLTGVLPIILAIYGDLDAGPVIAAYLASFFLASAFVAVGMFFSSLTRDQIIAMLGAVTVLIVMWAIGSDGGLNTLTTWGVPDPVVGALGAISPYRYFQSILRGVLDTRDLVYYACFCGFFLYANGLVLHWRRLNG